MSLHTGSYEEPWKKLPYEQVKNYSPTMLGFMTELRKDDKDLQKSFLVHDKKTQNAKNTAEIKCKRSICNDTALMVLEEMQKKCDIEDSIRHALFDLQIFDNERKDTDKHIAFALKEQSRLELHQQMIANRYKDTRVVERVKECMQEKIKLENEIIKLIRTRNKLQVENEKRKLNFMKSSINETTMDHSIESPNQILTSPTVEFYSHDSIPRIHYGVYGRSKQHHYELCWSCCLNVDKGAEGCVGQDAAIVNSHKDEVMPPIPKGNLKTSPHFDLWERNRLQDLTDNRGAFNARLQKNSFLSQSPSSSKLSRPSTAYTATAMVTATATEQGERSVLTSSYSNNRLKLKDDNNVNSRASIFQNRPATATSGGVRNSGNKNWSSSPPNTRIIFS